MAEDKLAKYILDDLVKWFKDERRNQLEDGMSRAYDAFRGRYDSDSLKKWKATEGSKWRSQVFVRMTKQKVVAGFSQVAAIALKGDEIRWDMSPTPIPESMPGIALDPEEAKRRCSLMKAQIQDDLVQCKGHKIALGSILEAAIYGWSWIIGPVLRSYKVPNVKFGIPGANDLYYSPEMIQKYGRTNLSFQKISRPVIENPSAWDVFWDLENPDHNEGHGIAIRDIMSIGRFLDLQDMPGYDANAIKEIKENIKGSEEASEEETTSLDKWQENLNKRKRVIPVYRFRGRVPVEKLKDYEGENIASASLKGKREVEVFCVVAKFGKTPRVIYPPRINPLPYRQAYKFKWEDLIHEPGGLGVPENIEDSQMVVNGLTRSMLDNKALSSNLLMWYNASKLAPGTNKTLWPGKSFEVNEAVEDVRTALSFFAPPDITGNTPKLIEFFKTLGDEESGISRTQEGQRMPRTTAYEISQIVESGNKFIGSIIRNHDNGHTGPTITGYYHWHMMINPDENLKGDYMIMPKGFQSYIEKAKRGQDIMELLMLSLSSEFTAQFTKVLPFLRELAASRDLEPDKFYPSDAELNNKTEQLNNILPKMRPLIGMGPEAENREMIEQ